jgi:hypothetical protein
MSVPILRDIPPRAAAVVITLALVASVVGGAPWTNSPPSETQSDRATAAPEVLKEEPLDLEALDRRKVSGTVPDLFEHRTPTPPPPVRVAVVAPPPVPVAPPLPFRYLGRFDDGDRLAVFLEEGQNTYSVAAGDMIDQRYRVERISDTSVTFRHVLLGIEQTLPIPKAP